MRLAHEYLLTSWARLARWIGDLEGLRQLAEDRKKTQAAGCVNVQASGCGVAPV